MRFLLADDHGLTRAGIRFVVDRNPDWQVCGEAGTGDEAVKKVTELRPDVIVLDLCMKGKSGLQAAKEIRRIAPETKIVFFSMHDVPAVAKIAEADGFACKCGGSEELVAAIRKALHEPET